MDNFFQSKANRLLVSAALVVLVVALASYAYSTWRSASNQFGPITIAVSGEGEVKALPDVGQFTYSVTREGVDANEATTKAAEASVAVLEYLKAAGVEEKDIKTENYSLYPKYRWEEQPCPMGSMYCPPGESVPDGFEVTETVQVKVRDLSKAGDLIGGVTEKGATTVSGLSFTIDDDSRYKAEALQLAIADAKAKADVLAKNLDVRIVKMVNYYEEEIYDPYYGYGHGMDMMATPKVGSTSPEPQPGERTIQTRVNVTYQVK